MATGQRDCATNALYTRILAGTLYTRMHGNYFGSTPVVLDDIKDTAGASLTLSLPEALREENNLGLRFGLTEENMREIVGHVGSCADFACREAKERWGLAGKLLIGGFPKEIALRCAVESGASRHDEWAHGASSPMHFPNSSGWEKEASVLAPYFQWFLGESRKDWVWPSEVGWPRLSGRCTRAKIDAASGNLVLSNLDPEGPEYSVQIPLRLIRKAELGEIPWGRRDTWFNPEIYHVNTLSDPEVQSTINQTGGAVIYFRDDLPGISAEAERFVSTTDERFFRVVCRPA